ncbi:MAG: F0F1 ATP synthase subunit A [Candidatus Liptonbacteria bacterium]|nr:F0F1 ATP synthase subunit A [Candidatus Liptonbacteria bacterium]
METGPEISLRAEPIFHLGSFTVTNSLLLGALAALLLIILGLVLRRKLTLIPSGIQNVAETALEGLLGLMDSVLGSRHLSEKYLPLVATIFVFVLTSNWLGLLPGMGSILVREGASHVPLLRSPSADLNFTLGLAIVAVLAINVFGVAAIGIWKHAGKFFNFKNPILFSVGFLELISEFARMVSFSFRLFGNVFAGEVLLIIIGFLVPYIVPLPFLFLEIFVGLIQAFIFAMLTLVFIAGAVAENH